MKDAAFVGGVGGTFDGDGEVAEVVGVGDGAYAGYGLGYETLGFLCKYLSLVEMLIFVLTDLLRQTEMCK